MPRGVGACEANCRIAAANHSCSNHYSHAHATAPKQAEECTMTAYSTKIVAVAVTRGCGGSSCGIACAAYRRKSVLFSITNIFEEKKLLESQLAKLIDMQLMLQSRLVTLQAPLSQSDDELSSVSMSTQTALPTLLGSCRHQQAKSKIQKPSTTSPEQQDARMGSYLG